MVVIFKTDVWEGNRAVYLIAKLKARFPACRINFDLDDCDRVLRIEGEQLQVDSIRALLDEEGCCCEELV